MMDNEAPAAVAETESAGIDAILANDAQPAPAAEAKAEPAPEPAKQEAAPEAKPETPAPEAHPFYFRKAIEKERKERQRLERELEQARQGQPQAQQPTFQNVEEQVQYYRTMDRLERSEDRFIDKHGERAFEEVREWMASLPDTQRDSFEALCMQQRHPWETAHEHYRRAKTAAEIGDDPAAWRARQEKEIEDRILERLATEGRLAAPGMASRPNIPAPASGQRSAAPRNSAGQFAGPTPLGDIIGKR